MADNSKTVVVAKDDAVFRLDENGRWHNRHGPFEHPKIADHFHRSIRKDRDGYHLFQSFGEYEEKVYFPYEDCALFVFEARERPEGVDLVLNTGRRVRLDPKRLFVRDDALYVRLDDEIAKFAENALLALSKRLDFREGGYFYRGAGDAPSTPIERVPTEAF